MRSAGAVFGIRHGKVAQIANTEKHNDGIAQAGA
ncbi:hypothetical protein M2360_004248 [Rhizobium sp. SG_E_25_P2]|nr:hypothetical protein [Rhizobium sp. SG_E_25_P2]